jgi:predicted GH43/DUF377 family glycosyl hydrolase
MISRLPSRAVTFAALILGPGCLESRSSPTVGECAAYPKGVYDYGEIGIGSCLSGPIGMEWVEDPLSPGRYNLLVANANPMMDFTGGSLVSIDIDAAPRDGSRTLISDIARSHLDMPSFPGSLALVPERGLALVTNRLSEESRTRVGFDDVYFVDVTDPGALAFAPAGPDGETHLTLMSDPVPMIVDDDAGRAYVGNMTSHTISVVDVLANPIDVIDARPRARITPGRFFDRDGSGSQVEIARAEIDDAELVLNQDWTLRYAEGVHRLWVPETEGLRRYESPDALGFLSVGFGPEAKVGDLIEGTGLEDPQPYSVGGVLFMSFVDPGEGSIRLLTHNDDELSAWSDPGGALLRPTDGAWDERLGGPTVAQVDGLFYLFYDGLDADGVGRIGLATAGDGLNYRREGVLIEPGAGAHDSERVADPALWYDDQAQLWRMFYSAFDGASWTIGHAESTNLLDWTPDTTPSFVPDDGADVGAPVVVYVSGELRLYTARRGEDGLWDLALARSPDGVRWTDEGVVVELNLAGDEPPGVGLASAVSEVWGLDGSGLGTLQVTYTAGDVLVASSFGYAVQLSAGAILGPEDMPAEGEDGVQVDTYLPDEGLLYLSLTRQVSGVDQGAIGLASWSGEGLPRVSQEEILTGAEGAFDAAGVSHPVVFEGPDGGYLMLYAGQDAEGRVAIGLAESDDGLDWSTDHSVALDRGEEWDSLSVTPGSVVVEDDGSYTLWYTGADGSRSRIGRATSTDGRAWTRASDTFDIGTGAPGEIDDSAVRHPFVLREDGVEHLWYAGFDGDVWSVVYASRASGDAEWTRAVTPGSDRARPVIQSRDGNFDANGAYRPVVHRDDLGVYRALYTGQDGLRPRVGLAEGLTADRLYRVSRAPSVGDEVLFSTIAGDENDEDAIPLEQPVDGFQQTLGLGVSSMVVDEARGFLYASSRFASYIYAFDIRDDSDTLSSDDKVNELEAVLVANTDVGATAFRGLFIPDGTDLLYALNSEPESVMIFDLAAVEDRTVARAERDAVIGVLPAPREERDAGGRTTAFIGPSGITQADHLLFVANFNANSVSVYDLRLGVFGELVYEIRNVGENPHALSVSPDGSLLVVANMIGEVRRDVVSSTLTLIDLDPVSPTYLQIVGWIVNQ